MILLKSLMIQGIKAERKIDGTGKAFEDYWPQAKKVKQNKEIQILNGFS